MQSFRGPLDVYISSSLNQLLEEIEDNRIESLAFNSLPPFYFKQTLTQSFLETRNSFAVLSDGQIVTSGSDDNSLKAWNIESGKCLHTLTGHTDVVTSVAVLSDGRVVSGSDDNSLKVWDLESSQCLHTLTGHTDVVTSVAALSDGRVISSSYDNTLKVWDTVSGKCLHTLTSHTDWVLSVAAFPGDRVISGSKDTTLKVWDIGSGECLQTLTGHFLPVTSVATFPDGRVISGSFENILKVWDIESGQCLQTLTTDSSRIQYVTSVAVLPDGRVISSSNDTTLKVWDIELGEWQAFWPLRRDCITCVAMLPDGRVGSFSANGDFNVWEWGSKSCYLILCEQLLTNTSLTSLDLSKVDLSLYPQLGDSLISLLKHHPNLHTLDLSNCHLNNATFKPLFNVIRAREQIVQLRYSGNHLSARALRAISGYLAKRMEKALNESWIPDVDFWLDKGNAHLVLRQFTKVLCCYEAALNLEGWMPDVDFWLDKSTAHSELNQITEAVNCCEAALNIEESHLMAWEKKGLLHIKLKEFAEAEVCFQRLVDQGADRERPVRIRILKQIKKERHFIALREQEAKRARQATHYRLEQRTLQRYIEQLVEEDRIAANVERIHQCLEALSPQATSKLFPLVSSVLAGIQLPGALMVPDEAFTLWERAKGWQGFPLTDPKHPAFKMIQAQIKKIAKLLKKLSRLEAPTELRTAFDEIRTLYKTFIEQVCEAEDETLRQRYLQPPVLLQGTHFPHHTLKPEYAERLLDSDSNTESGMHIVKAIEGVHYKQSPHAPGIEFMVDSLNNLIAGHGSAPTQLLKVVDPRADKGQIKHHVFQASKTVEGTELQFILEQHPEYLEKIDPANFSAMVVSSLLVNHQDGKPDNFMTQLTTDEQGNVVKLTIIGIDNDIAFVSPFFKSETALPEEERHYLQIRNVLYLFPNMALPVDPGFREAFLTKHPALIVLRWLDSLYQKNLEYQALLEQGFFTIQEFTGDPDAYGDIHHPYTILIKNEKGLQLPIQLPNGLGQLTYRTLRRIHHLLRKDSDLTHQALFSAIQPRLAYYYQQVAERFPGDIMRQLLYLYYGEKGGVNDKALQSIGGREALEEALARGEMEILTQLALSTQVYLGFEDVRHSPLLNELHGLLPSIDLSEEEPYVEQLVLQTLKELHYIQHLTLNGAKTLTGELFPYLEHFTVLETLTWLTGTGGDRARAYLSVEDVRACLEALPNLEMELSIEIPFDRTAYSHLLSLPESDRIRFVNVQASSNQWLTTHWNLKRYQDRPMVLIDRMIRKGVDAPAFLKYLLHLLEIQVETDPEALSIKAVRYNHGGSCLHEIVYQTLQAIEICTQAPGEAFPTLFQQRLNAACSLAQQLRKAGVDPALQDDEGQIALALLKTSLSERGWIETHPEKWTSLTQILQINALSQDTPVQAIGNALIQQGLFTPYGAQDTQSIIHQEGFNFFLSGDFL